MGFTETQIEKALSTYHQQHGTVYNVDVFINMIVSKTDEEKEIDGKNDDNDDDEVDKKLECSICHKLFTDPVRNIYDQKYCFHCIKQWYEMIGDDQTQIKDPNTNQALPQHCRLLIPHFSNMLLSW